VPISFALLCGNQACLWDVSMSPCACKYLQMLKSPPHGKLLSTQPAYLSTIKLITMPCFKVGR
jgi:hypothetical protein